MLVRLQVALLALVAVAFSMVNASAQDERWSDTFTPTNYRLGAGSAAMTALTTYHGDLYAAGNFNQADSITVGAIARWDGVGWRDVGGGVRGEIFSVTTYDNCLVAGGSFRVTESPSDIDLAVWDGAQWSGVPIAERPRNVQGVAALNGSLYMFAFFDGVARVAQWDGVTLKFLGEGFSGSPSTDPVSLLPSPQNLYLGFNGTGSSPGLMDT